MTEAGKINWHYGPGVPSNWNSACTDQDEMDWALDWAEGGATI